jgi:prepilin-type processing-associated H-X9-DG protein
MLLPAVQKVREAAARSQCQNNLKQLGLGLQNFASTYSGKIPAGVIQAGWITPASIPAKNYSGAEGNFQSIGGYPVFNHSGFIAILPYIEQGNLFALYQYGQIASNVNTAGGTLGANSSNPNPGVAGTYIKLFVCPSDEAPPLSQGTAQTGNFENLMAGVGAVRSNYLMNAGDRAIAFIPYASGSKITRGAFGHNGSADLTSIKDGNSNTIAYGEHKQSSAQGSNATNDGNNGPFWGVGNFGAVLGYTYDSATYPSLPLSSAYIPNYANVTGKAGSPGPCYDTPNAMCQAEGAFGSTHTGVTNFVFLDGSVRSIANNVDAAAFAAAGTPSGQESVSINF